MKLLQACLLSLVVALVSFNAQAGAIDINSADAATLDKNLKGIGPRTAAAIVDYRTKHGPFKSVDELANVKGVGPATIEKNRARLTASGNTGAAAVKTSAPMGNTGGAATGNAVGATGTK